MVRCSDVEVGTGLYTWEFLLDVHKRRKSGGVEASSLQSWSRKLRGDVATFQAYTSSVVPGTWKF